MLIMNLVFHDEMDECTVAHIHNILVNFKNGSGSASTFYLCVYTRAKTPI